MNRINLTNLSQEVEKYQNLVQKHPDDGTTWYYLALVYHKQQKFDEAKKAYKKSLSLEENPEVLLCFGEMLFDLKEFEDALDYLLRTLKLAKTTSQIHEDAENLVDTIYSLDSCSL